MIVTYEYIASQSAPEKNVAPQFGFDACVLAWSDDDDVLLEICRLLSHAKDRPEVGGKNLANLDLTDESPFYLRTAQFEDLDLQGLLLPVGTDLSQAHFIGCNLLDVNLLDCRVE